MASRPGQMKVPLIAASALFMEILDAAVINVTLPLIAASYHTEPAELSSAVTANLLGLAIFLPISGYVAERLGARRVFCAAIMLFSASSVAVGMSETVWQFTVARLVQGAGGALMVPVARLLILKNVERHDLLRAMNYFTLPALIAPALGPPLGGLLAAYGGWRLVFFINAPIGILGLALVLRFIPPSPPLATGKMDLIGWLLVSLGLIGLLTGVEALAHQRLDSMTSTGILVGGLTCGLIYWQHARRAPDPILHVSLFGIDTFRISQIGGILFRMSMGASQIIWPLMLQLGHGLSTLTSGLVTMFFALGLISTKFVVAPLFRRFGFRHAMIWSTISCGISFIPLCFTTDRPDLFLLCALNFVNGGLRSLGFSALNTLTFADVEGTKTNHAATISVILLHVGLAFGVMFGLAILRGSFSAMPIGATALDAYRACFGLLALFTIASACCFLALPKHAGANLNRDTEHQA